MTLHLYRKELTALLRDGRAIALGLAALFLFAAVLATSMGERRERVAEKQRVEAFARAQWDTQGSKHPHRGAHLGIYVFRPESLLASFDPGITRHAGQALWLEPHHRNMMRYSEANDDIGGSRLGPFTPALVLHTALALLVFVLCAHAVAQERESGTLRMLYGSGVKGATLLFSKFAALFTMAGLLLASALVAGALLADPAEMNAAIAARAGGLAVAYLLYLAVLIAIGLAVSSICRTSRASLFALIALWLTMTIAVPRVGNAAASYMVQLPSPQQFWAGIRHDYEQGIGSDGNLKTRNQQFDKILLERYGVSRLEDVPAGAYALRRLHRDAYADRVHARHFSQLWDSYYQQERIVRAMAAASPAVAIQSLSMALAGTDLYHQQAFEDAAEKYRRYVNSSIDGWDAQNTKGMVSFDLQYADNRLWQSVRPFRFEAPESASVFRRALADFIVMLAWVAAAATLLIFSARRIRC